MAENVEGRGEIWGLYAMGRNPPHINYRLLSFFREIAIK